MSEQRQIMKDSQIMVAVTSASRVFGLVRDQVIAFGALACSVSLAWFKMVGVLASLSKRAETLSTQVGGVAEGVLDTLNESRVNLI